MDGRVVLTKPENRMAAVRTKSNSYAVFEVFNEFKVKPGDLISGQFNQIGKTNLVNLTQRTLLKTDVKTVNCYIAHKIKNIMGIGKEKKNLQSG
ncbi:MAG: hypothetical protein HQK54_08925 [Oligoflexales bacterium]|nr:hypothetical protein [Oligoflexales bacterium]